MSFEHYNVEVRDRVKCISGIEGRLQSSDSFLQRRILQRHKEHQAGFYFNRKFSFIFLNAMISFLLSKVGNTVA